MHIDYNTVQKYNSIINILKFALFPYTKWFQMSVLFLLIFFVSSFTDNCNLNLLTQLYAISTSDSHLLQRQRRSEGGQGKTYDEVQ